MSIKNFKKSNHFDEYWGISFLFIFRNLYIYIIGLFSCIFPISPLFSYHFFFFVIDWEGFVYGYFLLLFLYLTISPLSCLWYVFDNIQIHPDIYQISGCRWGTSMLGKKYTAEYKIEKVKEYLSKIENGKRFRKLILHI